MSRIDGHESHRRTIDRYLQRLKLTAGKQIPAIIGDKPIDKRVGVAGVLWTRGVRGIDRDTGAAGVFDNQQVALIIRMDSLETTFPDDAIKRGYLGRKPGRDLDHAAGGAAFLREQ